MPAPQVPSFELRDGSRIPQLGYGTLNLTGPDGRPDDAATTDAVAAAIAAGYRHIDTAQGYKTEVGVGRAIAASGLPRDEFWVTTKLGNNHHRPEDVHRTIADSLDRLGLDYVDLFLMHWPLPTRYGGDYVTTWREMAGLVDSGQVRAVGVSNFQPAHLDRIVTETGIIPVVDQVELHPKFANTPVVEAARRHGVAVEAWSPLAQGRYLQDPALVAIADQTGRTPAQVVLRWHLERGHIVFPKSQDPARMTENLGALDFTLTPQQHATLTAMDQGEDGRNGPHPDTFDWIPE